MITTIPALPGFKCIQAEWHEDVETVRYRTIPIIAWIVHTRSDPIKGDWLDHASDPKYAHGAIHRTEVMPITPDGSAQAWDNILTPDGQVIDSCKANATGERWSSIDEWLAQVAKGMKARRNGDR